MKKIDIFIQHANKIFQADPIGAFSKEDRLIYADDGGNFKAHLTTSFKFGLLTTASPLISFARLVRSAIFLFSGDGSASFREFLGALGTPLIAAGCLTGSLASSAIYPISSSYSSFYISMRRTYGAFEAWVNGIELKAQNLPSYSHRVSDPADCFKGRIWTTAPCMQPVFENGLSNRGGLLDPARMQKMFPLLPIKNIALKEGKIVLEIGSQDENVHYIACNGAYEHKHAATTCCCCFKIDAIYDRILCCEVGRGSCTSLQDSGDSCGIISCSACGLMACCCYAKEKQKIEILHTGCFGPGGSTCLI